MASVIIIYGSTTGNTENTSEQIEKVLSEKGMDVTLKDVSDVKPADINDYDMVLMGCSTWGDEDIELQDDFIPFYEDLGSGDFSGKKVAVFGCGDSSYTHFCGAVDAIEEKVRDLGGKLVVDGLKIDGDPDDAEDDIKSWAEEVSNS
ncbi:MAG: flavodoxin [Deltaproteobacteria bacterium]|nr:MAG: flavodoxin [Deltaproteobacteria bacterium]